MTYKLLSTIGLAVSLAALPRVAVAQIVLEPVVSGLDAPVGFLGVPGLTGAHVILEHGGRIRLLQDGALQQNDFLDLRSVVRTGGEWGLLGLAFPADYLISRRVFINFIDSNGNTVVARFECLTDLLHPDPATRFDLLWPGGTPYIPQPDTPMHKGGNMAFGPDGHLYIGLGDGGEGDDIYHRAQDPLSLLGKMLRIDVSVGNDDPEGYDVPADNPFAGRDDVLGEIWAFGLRNPWRWSFDDPRGGGGTGALIITDVGQDDWEEIDYEPAGAGGRNYGWRVREGAHDHLTSLPPFSWNLTDPTFEYNHEMGRAVIGGFVYRGSLLGPEYRGKYFFADYMSGDVWALDLGVDPQSGEAVASGLTGFGSLGSVRPSSFGTDGDNELYLVSHAYGQVYRLALREPTSEGQCGLNGDPCPNTKTSPGNGAVHQLASLTLSWTSSDGATGYEYCFDATNDDDCSVWTPVGNSLSVEVAALTSATTYYWQVRALGSSGATAYADGSLSAFWNFTTGTGVPEVPGDFDGDGHADIVWQHANGSSAIWLMNGVSLAASAGLIGPGTGWSVAQTADFNGDGKNDILSQHTDGSSAAWLMNGVTATTGGLLIGPGTGWTFKQTGDFNGDGRKDILWQHTDGSTALWLMNGVTAAAGAGLLGSGTGWSTVQVGDFNGDGKSDIVWLHTDGRVALSLMGGTVPDASPLLLGPATGWSVRQIGDFNGDGKSDIVWQHTDGRTALWLMNGVTAASGGALLGPGTGWSAVKVGDFNGDGTSDVLWQHADGSTAMWLMNGLTATAGAGLLGGGTGWSAVQVGDFNGDGKSDVVWLHVDGSSAVWLMNGLTLVESSSLRGPATGWSPVP